MSRSKQSKPLFRKPRQVRDAEATKSQILDAAMEEFAKYGLNGARTENIASGSGVTKAMIYYYFESKEALYQAVLNQLALQLNELGLAKLNLNELHPESALKTAVYAFITYQATHPCFGRILWQEALQNQGKYYKQIDWNQSYKYLLEILERGINIGCFRQFDPFLTAMHINGVCNFYFDAYENIKHLTPNLDLRSPEMIEKHAQAAIDFIMAGVANRGEE
ncbi:TetR/AcrR family transcriptional regulator [Rivularia sp. UHCC 0363]|uniref:TetR/AcrR family transcriptional regulator n=1 Tax=Rivularia sp. UHCC 0363 TaxID=3110244 RepID=UPI002B209F42|nr:TetR/AcrR family transcriptional regulator [Rivularia sp. UHCC 0363]MEA5597748.1 TetR/AcrR family transcriptional regulator [Rivularia sp. UHCC 0363]